MLANVFAKASADRTTGMAVGAAVIGLMLWAGMAVYRDIDLAIYDSLPPGSPSG